jgi:hypothetical protein
VWALDREEEEPIFTPSLTSRTDATSSPSPSVATEAASTAPSLEATTLR